MKPYAPFAFTPDARLVAAPGPRVWDVLTGAARPALAGAPAGSGPVAITPDGATVAAAVTTGEGLNPEDERLRVWDLAAGAEVARAERDDNGRATAVAVSPDGTLVAEGRQIGSIRTSGRLVLSDRAGREVRRFGSGNVQYAGVAFSPDGTTLVTATWGGWAGQDGVKLWDVATGRLVRALGPARGAGCVVFSPDGRRVAAGRGTGVDVWDAATGEALGRVDGHAGAVTCVAFSPDGKTLASGGADTTVLVWPVPGPVQ